MSDWLKRNRTGLITLLAVIPLLIVVMVGVPSWERASRISAPVEVAAGETGEAHGLSFSVRAAGEFVGGTGSIDLPSRAAIVAAVIDVAPVDGEEPTAATCTLALTTPSGGELRTWLPQFDVARYGYQRGDADEFATSCDARSSESYSIEAVFLTPSGVVDDASVEVTLQRDGVTETLRLHLPEPAPAQG